MNDSPRTWMILSASPPTEEELAACGSGALFVYTEPGLGGAWTESRSGVEVVRFGAPENPESAWFRVNSLPRDGHNVLSLAIERMIFARRIHVILVLDEALEATCRRGARIHRPPPVVDIRTAVEPRIGFLSTRLGAAAGEHAS